jgi:hypothetical protein
VKTATVKALKQCLAVVVSALLVLVVWIALRRDAPPLRIVDSGSKLTVDVSTLGEYPTTVTHVRLYDTKSRAVVWEFTADREAQLRELTFVAGQNPARVDADYGSYRVITPTGSTSFFLERGREYRIELWGNSTALAKTSASFRIR